MWKQNCEDDRGRDDAAKRRGRSERKIRKSRKSRVAHFRCWLVNEWYEYILRTSIRVMVMYDDYEYTQYSYVHLHTYTRTFQLRIMCEYVVSTSWVRRVEGAKKNWMKIFHPLKRVALRASSLTNSPVICGYFRIRRFSIWRMKFKRSSAVAFGFYATRRWLGRSSSAVRDQMVRTRLECVKYEFATYSYVHIPLHSSPSPPGYGLLIRGSIVIHADAAPLQLTNWLECSPRTLRYFKSHVK